MWQKLNFCKAIKNYLEQNKPKERRIWWWRLLWYWEDQWTYNEHSNCEIYTELFHFLSDHQAAGVHQIHFKFA